MRTLLAVAMSLPIGGCGTSSTEQEAPAKRAKPSPPAQRVGPAEASTDELQKKPTPALEALQIAEPGKAFGQILIQTQSREVHRAELTIVRAEGKRAQPGTLPYLAEPRVVIAPPTESIDENDLLGSGIAIDLDGDGSTSSRLATRCVDGTLSLDSISRQLKPVTELTDDVVRFIYGADGARTLSAPSAGFSVYSPCGGASLAVGLNARGPLRVHKTPSPSAFVVYRVEVDGFSAEDPFALQSLDSGGKPIQHELHSFREVNVEDGGATIYAAHLVVFAIDPGVALQQVSVAIAGVKPEFITASVNEVDTSGNRIRYGDGFKRF